MARELVRGAGQAIAAKGASAIKKHAKKAAKKVAAKKHAAKKHAAKKHAKKAAKHASHDLARGGGKRRELSRAFHHLQRASAVISLIDAESGGDLKMLLQSGVELYQRASAGEEDKAETAAELLRATEHLAMAGLYAARGGGQLRIEEPPVEEIERLARAIGTRLAGVDPETEYGVRLHAMIFELVKRAEGSEDDPHLAWELVNGADGICAALEVGFE